MHFRIGQCLHDGLRPLVMGIINATPDSFYDGSRYSGRNEVLDMALAMVAQGADIIDIGGVSSRPGAEDVSEDEELNRVIPLVEALARTITIPLSVDTYRVEVARRAIDAGACLINDISAVRFDEAMAALIAERGVSVVLMHMQGIPRTMQVNPEYDDVVGDILDFFRERIDVALAFGIGRAQIIVDPGIGFGKTVDHNLAILRNIDRFHETGCAVLVGASRKSMIAAVTGARVEDRYWGTAAITAHCVAEGIEIHRVHDVGAMRQVCDMAAALRG